MAKKYAGLDTLRTFLDNLKALFATKTEVSNKADKTHTHDDRYYTENEIDSKVSTINASITDIVNGTTTVAKATKATSADSATTAASATKATQDGNNNVIASTYEKKTDATAKLGEAKSYTDSKTANLASTTVVDNKISTHNTSTSAHSDIRVLITDLTTKLNNFLDVDDTTTDQLSEIITLINNNKGTLESLTTSKVNVSDIVDNLTTASTSKVLSANQGVVIKNLINTLQNELDSHTHIVSDITDLTVTATELNYMDGVTANVQTQLNNKASSSHTHTISDVTNLQTALDGKASTDLATQSTSGLMSAEDKIQLDYGGTYIATATSSDNGVTYTATVDGISTFKVGMKITITPDTTSTVTNPKLNVNSLGAKTIRMPVAYYTSFTTAGPVESWLTANKPIDVQWNGTYWVTVGFSRPSAQYLYGTVPVESGGTGATDATTALTNLGAQAAITGTPGQFVVIGDDGNVTTKTVPNAEEASF